MHRRHWFAAALAICAIVALAPLAQATTPLKEPQTGSPNLKSIEAITFGPDGLLLIGDGKGKQVVAIDTGDTKETKWTKTTITDIKDQLAGRIGSTAKGIEIRKVAVNPASRTAYFAIRGLDAKKDLILTVDGAGKVKEFALDNVKFIAVPLPADQKITAITDICWAGDRVLVAAQASDTFASKIFSIKAPLTKDAACGAFSTETFHVGHNKWETKAPIRVAVPYEENGKKYLVGSFTCTPIVKYCVDDMTPDGKIKGISVIELGTGNTPQDMFVYEKGGKKYILMNCFRMFHANNPAGPSEYWTARVELDVLKETNKINEKAVWRTKGKANKSDIDTAIIAADFHGVMQMDLLDNERALVIRKDDKGGIHLNLVNLP